MNTKLKICSVCGVPSKLWKSVPKLCKKCSALNKPVRSIKRPEPIKRVSDKKKKLDLAYNVLCRQFKKDNPICQARVKCSGALTIDVHHRKGRGEYYLDNSTFLAVCRECHNWIEMHPKSAKSLGLSECRLSK